MNHRKLGKTGLSVSEIGFGAWAIGADWGEAVPEAGAREAVHAALDAGMDFIDTADIYGGGRSETIIGEVLRERKEGSRPVIATKMGRGPDWSDDYDAIARAAEGSIQRLGVDSLDLVQLHCIEFDLLKSGKVFQGLEKAKEVGLIRNYGVSVETVEEGLFCIENSGSASLQVIFNVFRQKLVDELFPLAKTNDVGIIARVPLASGVLTGKFSRNHQFHAEDHRHFNSDGQLFNVGETFAGVPFGEGVELAREIEEITKDDSPGAPLSQKALRWILDFDAVSSVIPGAKNREQAEANAGAADLAPLSEATHAAIAELYKSKIHASVRGAY